MIFMPSLKTRLTLFLLQHHLSALFSRKMTVARLIRSLKKQLIVSSLFRDAKYSLVGSKIFIDPFAPYFPSSYCRKLFNNNCEESYPPKPNFAQISITNHCPCCCVHCHVVNSGDIDLPKEVILEAIRQIAAADFPLLFFVGGEPMMRFDDLLEFVALAHEQMDTRIFTSGVGASPERLKALRRAGLEGICVSLDHSVEAVHNDKRGHPAAFKSACDTIIEAVSLGFYVSVVCCTTSEMVRSGEVFKVVDLAESLGAHSIQLNEIRPVGRAIESAGYDFFFTAEDKETLISFYREANWSVRSIAIVMPWYNEEPDKFGCTAASGQQAYIDANGNVQPCPLLKVGFGNITSQNFTAIWDNFRSHCGPPVRECLVHHFADEINSSEELPLPAKRAYELWPEVRRIDTTDLFKRMKDI
jgi:MoaA/NifB/PqqE/SkfB family radical SAM enzyme